MIFDGGQKTRASIGHVAMPAILLCLAVLIATNFGCKAKKKSQSADTGPSTSSKESSEPKSPEPAGAKVDPRGGITTKPLGSPESQKTGAFTRLDNEVTGLQFVNELRSGNMRKYLLNGAGLCTGDFDNDGLVDIYAISQDGPNKLFRQTTPWKFDDVTEAAGGLDGGSFQGTGASFADVDNDGWLDLYVCNINGPNLLFVNQRDGSFVEEGKRRNANVAKATTMASFADYDRDGDLDMYLVNNRVLSMAEESPKIMLRKVGDKQVVHPDFLEQYFLIEGRIQEAGQRDRLLQNDGQGNFVDVTDAAGINGYDMGLSATWWDYDNDGWVDVYVANDLKSPDHLYRNLGDGSFQDVLPDAVGHTPWFSMGADAADINNDGLLDLLVADMSSTTHYKQKTTMGEMGNSAWFLTTGKPRQFMRNTLFLNSGTERFFEAANLTGLDSTDWSWSIKFADFDSDSMVDVFVTNGVGRNMNDSDWSARYKALMEAGKKDEAAELLAKMPALKEANLAFRNQGDLQFQQVATHWGVDHLGVSQGASVADIDRDGDLDLLVNNMNEPLGVYRNDIGGQNNLLVSLRGSTSNRYGIDAKVVIQMGKQSLVRHMKLASGFMSADEPVIHFGLGNATTVSSLTVHWPSGAVQKFDNVQSNQHVTIMEGTENSVDPASLTQAQTKATWFVDAAPETGLTHRHREFEFDDYSIQPLLPNKLSQLGPGVAWADVNGDQLHDCFIGGGAGHPCQLYLQTADGTFQKHGAWNDARPFEDMGLLFFDIDSDGDQDLYVASGGYERAADSPYLQDRLYLNDGEGNFQIAPKGTIPERPASSSCVSAADFDRDGDLDLFVGTRLIPGKWPLPADSFLLENRDGRLVDATDEFAKALNNIGLVTSSIWSDVDQDGWVDLLVTLEWGTICFLKNEEGKLVDRTAGSGLENHSGWWNSISGGDIDNDGDIDYVAMNVGLNTKYHATDQHPVVLFADDFDDNGVLDLIEAEYEGDVCYPVRGKSCSSHAMPFLNEKFDSYHEFALADVSTIYSDESLKDASRFSVNTLSSVVLVNDGTGNFQVHALPRMAQISPGFGTSLQDFDADGNLDLLIAQNFLHPQPETGQMDGGMGMLLKGNGDATFEFIPPGQSGVMVLGQGMAVTTIDLNDDAAPDTLFSVNDDIIRSYRNNVQFSSAKRNRYSLIIENGAPANPNGVGSVLTTITRAGIKRGYEMRAGEGYLSQSAPIIFVVDDSADPIESVLIRWPDGGVTDQPFGRDTSQPGHKRFIRR